MLELAYRTWPILLVNVLYIGQAGMSVFRGEYPQVAMLLGYVVANCGLVATFYR